MKKIPLYRYTGRNGFITTEIYLDGVDSIKMYRLVADSGKILQNRDGLQDTIVDIFAEDIDNWKEVEDNSN